MAIDKNMITVSPETARAVEEYLVSIGKQISDMKYTPQDIVVNGAHYIALDGRINRVDHYVENDPPTPDDIAFFTLNGLVEYIKTDVDGIFGSDAERYIVRVTDEAHVEILSKPIGYYKRRTCVARCTAPVPDIHYGMFLATEDFQTMMQTCFSETENRNLVMRLAGSVHREQSMRKSDDGMTQTVTVKDGVSVMSDVTFKNPVTLVPLRTFYEVEQPVSPFVLRFDEEGNAALYEGDGGAWKLEAVKRVTAWLKAALDGTNVEVIG